MPLPRGNMFFGLGPKLTDEQRKYVDSIFDYQLTIVNAKAGTGKTTLAVGAAKLIGKPLLYIFNPTEEHVMGHRPGTQAEKEAAYLGPLLDALLKIGEDPYTALYDPRNVDALKQGRVWVTAVSHTFFRGTNIQDKTIIIDEAQNFTKHDLKKVLTRIHDSCTVVMVGHAGQCDLPNPKHSGFAPYIEHFRDKDYCNIVELTKNFRGRLAQDADEIE
ncbi:PhoH family protein [Polycladomyces subterraneus]|jgi:phosphate starvation-inducible PhoH-like protein|uniref:PhoH family protein n=1 Tax=Polycladomyces subterraneus TaxID=1016997 RepID=A0ABT8IP60_9BACL|nr:PhoH family protein [Polycladomyces subterraneus]MDN4594576.1 PhoH family protein [Polycladomyces subterraneus]